MKKLIVGVMILAVGVAMAEDLSKLTEEQRTARAMARKAAKIAAKGGIVEKAAEGNLFCIVSMQKTIPTETLKGFVRDLSTGFRAPMVISTAERGKDVFADVAEAKKLPKAGAVMLVVDDPSLPTLLSASEDGWSVCNIAKLGADMPPRSVYDDRVRKEFNRGIALALGAGVSYNRPCVMSPVSTMKDLDEITIKVPSPEALSKMDEGCYMFGIKPVRRTTYIKACQEGWAPAPTNDVQRKIWKDVHEIPSQPLKLEK